jgi:Tol biopolymer transport system component
MRRAGTVLRLFAVLAALAGASAGSADVRAPSGPYVNALILSGKDLLAFTYESRLYVLGAGGVRRITNSGAAFSPAWSQDGRWVSWIQSPDPNQMVGRLYLARPDGTGAHVFLRLSLQVSSFAWAPRADAVAFTGASGGLWVESVSGRRRQLVPGTKFVSSYSWSRGSSEIAYAVTTRSGQLPVYDTLYTVPTWSGKPVVRMNARNAAIRLAGWWPGGNGVVYWLDPQYSGSLAADGMSLFTKRFGSARTESLGTTLGYRDWLAWSPNGRTILAVAGGGRGVYDHKQLVWLDVVSGSRRSFPQQKGYVALDPVVAPAATALAYGSPVAYVLAKDLGPRYMAGFGSVKAYKHWIQTRSLSIVRSDGADAGPIALVGRGIFSPMWSADSRHVMYLQGDSVWMIDIFGGNPFRVAQLMPRGRTVDENKFAAYYGHVDAEVMLAWWRG